MDALSTFGALTVAIAVVLVAVTLVEFLQRVITRERDAARAAIELEYERHLIDAEALARTLAALDAA